MTVHLALSTHLDGRRIDLGDLVEVHVPGSHPRWGRWAGLTRNGMARVTLWSDWIGGFCQQATTYSPNFIRRHSP